MTARCSDACAGSPGAAAAASWLLLAFPLVGAVVLLLGGRRTNRWGHLLGVAMPLAAFVYGVIAFVAMLGYPADQRSQGPAPVLLDPGGAAST